MACIKPDGSLTGTGKTLLGAMMEPVELSIVSRMTGMPLFKVRSVVRDLMEAKLVSVQGNVYKTTEEGLERMKNG